MRKTNSGVFMTRLSRSKSTGMAIMTKIYRSEGIYKHNEGFVFFTDEIDFVKDFIRPQH